MINKSTILSARTRCIRLLLSLLLFRIFIFFYKIRLLLSGHSALRLIVVSKKKTKFNKTQFHRDKSCEQFYILYLFFPLPSFRTNPLLPLAKNMRPFSVRIFQACQLAARQRRSRIFAFLQPIDSLKKLSCGRM